jgi:hypothetical protein
VTELDLGLKVGVRSLFWSMGLSTRIDVALRGLSVPTSHAAGRRSGVPDTFTDLDVLGVGVNSGYRLSFEIGDCKTSKARSTERMFWIRGVADLFGADHAYLVREQEVTDGSRQLAARLGITVLPTDDLQRLQGHHGPSLTDPSSALSILFDRKAVAEHLAAFNDLDRKLKGLLEYRQFDYWVYEEHRNPIQTVAHLRGVAGLLDPRNPVHVALLLDFAWLYLLSMIRVTEHVRRAFLGDLDRGLQEYIAGGPTNLHERRKTAELLSALVPDVQSPPRSPLPEYYPQLRELVTRLLRRPAHMQTCLRYAEAAAALAAAKTRIPLGDAFKGDYDAVAAKLCADVCGFLVAAADLDAGFRSRARGYLLNEPVEGGNRAADRPKAAPERAKPPNEASPVVKASDQLSLDADS